MATDSYYRVIMGESCDHSSSFIFSSPEPKAQGELIVWDSSRRPSVCPCVSPCVQNFKHISETCWPIIIKFHQKHHWGGGLTALGFRLDRIRTLVSMATDSSHRVIMGESCDHSSSFIFSSPEPKAQGELIVRDSSRCPSMCPCVSPCVHTFKHISETGWPIIIKFHQKHHWGGGLTALGFRLVRIRTLVSMATDRSHRVIMGESCDHSSSFIFSSPEPKAQGELIGRDSSRRPSVCESVRRYIHTFKHISETGWPIIIKFHLRHHWGGGLTALGFRLDWIRTLVSMATDSSYRVIMGKIL